MRKKRSKHRDGAIRLGTNSSKRRASAPFKHENINEEITIVEEGVPSDWTGITSGAP